MPASIYPRGVTLHVEENAYPTYVIFEHRMVASLLIDMNGNEVHSWPYAGHPSQMIDPAINGGKLGHVLVQKEPDFFNNETILELNWRGDVVWSWGTKAPGGKARQHHDMYRLANGNTMVLSDIERPVPGIFNEPVAVPAIYEVTTDGGIAWAWYCDEHFTELGYEGEKAKYLSEPSWRLERGKGSFIGLNSMQRLGENHRFRNGDSRFHPDNIIVGSRGSSFVAIIERATGKIVWRIGPELPGNRDMRKRAFTGPLPRALDSLAGQHDPHMIAEGLPGAGNILLFDNQGQSGLPPSITNMFPGSRILEIDPLTQQIVWQYDASCSGMPTWSFYSSFTSSVRRLPNGNTLICEGMYGRVFQVTPKGEIVWEFVNPHFDARTPGSGAAGGPMNNQIYRAYPVPYAWVPANTPRASNAVRPAFPLRSSGY